MSKPKEQNNQSNDKIDEKKEAEKKDEKIEEIAKVFNNNSFNKIEKPPKYTRFLFISFVVAVLFGFAGGIIGEISLNYLMLSGTLNIPWFNKLRLEQYLPTKEIIVNKREQVSVVQDIIVSEVVKKINESQVIFFKKIPASEKGVHVYGSSQLISSGVVVTNDGWVVVPQKLFTDSASQYIGMNSRGEVFNVKKIIPDQLLGVSYLETEAINVQASAFADVEKITIGQIALISDIFGKASKEIYINSLSFNPQYPIESSDRLSRFMAVNEKILKNYFGSSVTLLNGEVAGVVLDEDLVLPINLIKSRFKEAVDAGKIDQGFLGVSGINQEFLLETDVLDRKGILVSSLDAKISALTAKGAAIKAGLREDDILLDINDEAIGGTKGLGEILSDYRTGDDIEVKYIRNKKERTVNITLSSWPLK